MWREHTHTGVSIQVNHIPKAEDLRDTAAAVVENRVITHFFFSFFANQGTINNNHRTFNPHQTQTQWVVACVCTMAEKHVEHRKSYTNPRVHEFWNTQPRSTAAYPPLAESTYYKNRSFTSHSIQALVTPQRSLGLGSGGRRQSTRPKKKMYSVPGTIYSTWYQVFRYIYSIY